MTATIYRRREDASRSFTIERAREPSAMRSMLSEDRAYAAYALAQLDPARFHLSEWLVASSVDGQSALVVHSTGGLGRALFAQGDPGAVDAILSLHPGARFCFGSLRPQHRSVLEKYFFITRPQIMTRMTVTPETFTPAAGEAHRLTGRHVADVNRLYSTDGGPTAYHRSHLEEGVYYGVRADGRLAAIAGTHVVSHAEGVAVVGNVFTHARYRNRGLATIATSAVTAELLDTCRLVVLTVESDNGPALNVYRRLGYQPHCTLHESPLVRKEPLGALSLARRLVAAWRGRSEGKKVVVL
ncbi:MAG: GNAT family N-acetyltransferase [Chloroflexi bacterium]|nr:MAG: GNAT family N-acetyltransferase [Chloroflexota bacterium]